MLIIFNNNNIYNDIIILIKIIQPNIIFLYNFIIIIYKKVMIINEKNKNIELKNQF